MTVTTRGTLFYERSKLLQKLKHLEESAEQYKDQLEFAVSLYNMTPKRFLSIGDYTRPVRLTTYGVILHTSALMDFRDAEWIIDAIHDAGYRLVRTDDTPEVRQRAMIFNNGLRLVLDLDVRSDACEVIEVGEETYKKYKFVCGGEVKGEVK